MKTNPLENAAYQNVLLSSLSEQQAAEHVLVSVWEAGFEVDFDTGCWVSRTNNTYIIFSECRMLLTLCVEDLILEVPVTVELFDREWLLSRNNIDALITMNMQVLQQATGGEV